MTPNTAPQTLRYPLFDSLRGIAMILMAVFHFCFDLRRFGVFTADFNRDLFWILFRGVIMVSFMSLVGISFWYAKPHYSDRRYWSRFARVAGCALLISAVTVVMFPKSWIFFGVLHLIAFATLLAPLLVKRPLFLAPLAVVLILLPEFYTSPWFHQPGWNILGLSRWDPIAQDYAAIFPWLGVIFIGVIMGWTTTRWPTRVTTLENSALSRLGRHSLFFYMTHQVVLYPLAWSLAWLISKLWA